METAGKNLVTVEMLDQKLRETKEELLQRLASKEELAELKEELTGQKNSTSRLETEMSEMKKDVSVLKKDVSVLKKDVSVLKKDMAKQKKDLANLTTIVINNREYMRENMVTRKEMYEIFDRILKNQDVLMKMYEIRGQEMLAQDATTARLKKDMAKEAQRNDSQDQALSEHDSRISNLEKKSA
ncbi:hypothetical protein JXJ21_09645 [candidate division KSB1 bacterium]|nr:hypothetical protein [candidate division KSB1 bacterium]